MTISMIVAMDLGRVIGKDGDLPWRLSTDLKRFKRLTMGHTLVMGRKTYDSIGRPLPGRETVVLSRDAGLSIEGCAVVGGLDEALEAAGSEREVFVCGGAAIYALFLPRADRIYLTTVLTEVDGGDVYFPALDRQGWEVVESLEIEAGPRDAFPTRFEVLERAQKMA